MSSLEDRITAPSGSSAPAEAPQSTDWADDAGQMDGATSDQLGRPMAQTEYEVEVKLADASSPLHSVKSFEELGLSESILKGLLNMKFNRPSKIQEKALPLLLNNPPANMIGQSQSGTGKTAAFTLNILSRLDLSSEQSRQTPQALVLAPTRELARQIIGVIQVMGGFMEGLNVSAAIPVGPNGERSVINGQVVVGTAGTTMDLIRKRQLDTRGIKVLVLDEADNMLDQQGMGEQCMRVKKLLPPQLQVVLFSATFPEKVITYAKRFAPNANEITLAQEELTVEGISQFFIDCPGEESKYKILLQLYGLMTIGSSVIFVKRRDTAARLEAEMTAEGHKVASLTGAYEGAQRDAIIDSFRTGSAKVLITTNVLARGIDVQSVSMVINYDVPDDGKGTPDPQTYLHRIGRTGRFGRVGVSISFVHDQKSWSMLKHIADYYKVNMNRLPIDDWDYVEKVIKDVITSQQADPNYKPSQVM